MLAGAAHLPDAVVGLAPRALERAEQRDLEVPRVAVLAGVGDQRRVAYSVAITSPYTSSWNCSLAALPMRTGAEPS